MTDEQLIEAMARRLAKDDGANWEAAHFGETPSGETPEEMRDYYRGLATAALAALRETHHLIPRATEDDGELVNELTAWPASLGKGDALEVGFVSEKMQRAADRITALRAEVERLREALAAYTEYCDICHGRGSIIEEDAVTGADLWRDCPGCTPARAALKENPNAG